MELALDRLTAATTRSASVPPAEYAQRCTHQIETEDPRIVRTE